ncbi:MAG: phenylphosphate carboxylase subunit delta [Bdellovibrio sp. CG12_big_fil_rev_8_21_14_0_65_39_13]|nr:MAG: phenylphosphate carboxylase subunit delta [Bdellovibrio sp. CG22_combo_CG10-13_8_21_14_all_39_27]PIQ59286.1 MAG: phenylphosphate carboxylase subunit delta [Bdellovibrio sp. CG12_big_fil_rev_8_21_14_0_65_39_13]PIR32297.1 MAG: phenylphosphate carboxylase subunit delta [Bdellovibrio sp. CG11_big_fil_rev_8_21_14_0_20_39_38]
MFTKNEIKKIADQFQSKLAKIKVCAFDVDGVLTDATVTYHGPEIGWNRTYSILDGYGMKLLQKNGLKVGVITGGNSLSVDKRFGELLKLDFIYKGSEDKTGAFNELNKQGFSDEEILYMGDELFDIPLLKRAGFAATTKWATYEVFDLVDYIAQRDPGKGCAREVMDILRYARGFHLDTFEENLGQ